MKNKLINKVILGFFILSLISCSGNILRFSFEDEPIYRNYRLIPCDDFILYPIKPTKGE
jgi:hypothetical protein